MGADIAKISNSPVQSVECPWGDIPVPPGYTLRSNGVFVIDKNGEEKQICGPLWEVAKTRDMDGDGWGTVLCWIDQDGRSREHSFPIGLLYDSGKSVLITQLASMGLKIIPSGGSALLNYLASFHSQDRRCATGQTGWHIDADDHMSFVLPNEVLRLTVGELLVFQPESINQNRDAIKSSAELAHWQTHVANPCVGNPVLIFSLCAGLASPLLKLVGLDCTGFHFYGMSSQGKTTALQVASSVWGNGSDPAGAGVCYIQRWNSTVNALEALAANHNDILLALDEMATCDAHDFGRVVYNLAGGQGKSRLSKDSNLKPRREWHFVFLSTGEISVRQKIEESGKQAKAGQLNRLIDIPVTDQIILNSHGQSASAFADQLKVACSDYYGTAGPALINHILSLHTNFQGVCAVMIKEFNNCIERLDPNLKLSTDAHRAVRRMAVVLLAGEQSIDAGILPMTKDALFESIIVIRNTWLNNFVDQSLMAVLGVRDFVSRFHESKFWNIGTHLTSGPVIHDMAGYKDPGRNIFIFTDEGFKRACGDSEPRQVAAALKGHGLLYQNESGRFKSKHELPDVSGRARFYAVNTSILGFSLDAGTAGTSGQ